MEITEVRVKLNNRPTDRLKAYCTITFDEVFVVRDVKVVEGTHGLFVAMPSRKLAVPCPKCRQHNALRARFCSSCGQKLSPRELPADADGRSRLHRDVSHPITASFREELQTRVIEAYEAEKARAEDPDYAPNALETDADHDETGAEHSEHTDHSEDTEDSERSEHTEYDSLIADLRGGDRGKHGDVQAPRSGGGTDRAETARPGESRGGERGRRRGGRGRRPERAPAAVRSDARMDAPDSGPVTETSEPLTPDTAEVDTDEEPTTDSTYHTAREEPPSDAAGPTPQESPGQDAADQVDLGEATSEAPESGDSSEDSTPFGAGIL